MQMYLYPNLLRYDDSNGHQVVTGQILTKFITVKCFTQLDMPKKYILTQKGATNQTILRKSGDKSQDKSNHQKASLRTARLKKSFGTREISFHKCRYLLIFAVITQLFSAAAHSFVICLVALSMHLRASRKIKK